MSRESKPSMFISPTILSLLWQLTRHNDSAQEQERAQAAWKEFEQVAPVFRRGLVLAGIVPLVDVLRKSYQKSGQAPSEHTMTTFCREDYDDFYNQYMAMDKHEASPHAVTALASFWEAENQKGKLAKALEAVREKAAEEGAEAAVRLLFQEAVKLPSSGAIIESNLSRPACLDQVVVDLETRVQQSEDGSLNIKTGLQCLDQTGTFFQRGEVVGILGTGGGGKTTLARTMVYNATMDQHYKVLQFPLETTVQVELPLYVAQHVLRSRSTTLRRGMLKDGTIGRDSAAYQDFLWGISDLKARAQEGALRLPTFVDFVERSTWSAIRTEIYRQLKKEPIDLVVIDYLTLVSKEGAQSPREFMEEVIIDLARFAKAEGVAIVTPVQANRNSSSIVETGIWSKEQIFNYSEIEKSFDLLYSVYHGPFIHEKDRVEDGKAVKKPMPTQMMDGHVFLGTCKTRSVAPIESPVSAMLRHDGLYLTDPTPEEHNRLKEWDCGRVIDDPVLDWEIA